MSQVVTRFAPSPTGYLHVGGARTAIFNWLLARHTGGRYILRIEDTDRERSTPEAVQAILDGMAWLGLSADDEPVYQSARIDRHNAAIDQLLAEGKAYWCECTPDQVQAMRDKAMAEGRKPKYDSTCRERGLGPGPGRVVRLKTPLDGDTAWQDMVKGPQSIGNQEMDDLVLRRPDGSPTYNLAVVVDDHEMGVTHVLRGEDHLSNTPRQIILYRALGWETPTFGHVPMILGPDKKKLSKRHGAVAVTAYRDMGILAEAMRNYLLRLGWSHGDQEIFSEQEMIDLFTTDNLGSSAAVFDMDKLLWLNAHYIKTADPERLAELVRPFLANLGITNPDPDTLAKALPLLTPRSKTLEELADQLRIFLANSLDYDTAAVAKFLTTESRQRVADIVAILETLDAFDQPSLETAIQGYVADQEIKFKVVAQPLRVAVTGRTQSPGIYETMEALGKERTLARLHGLPKE